MQDFWKGLTILVLLLIAWNLSSIAYEIKQISNDYLRAAFREGYKSGQGIDNTYMDKE